MPTQQAAKGKMKGVCFSGKKKEERYKIIIKPMQDFHRSSRALFGSFWCIVTSKPIVGIDMVAVPLGGFPFLDGPFSFPNTSLEKKCNYLTRKVTELLSCFSPLNLLYTLYVHWYGIAWGMVVDRQIYHWLTFGLVFQVGIISTDEGFQYAELRERLRLEPGHKYVLVSEMPGLGEFENSPTLEQKHRCWPLPRSLVVTSFMTRQWSG